MVSTVGWSYTPVRGGRIWWCTILGSAASGGRLDAALVTEDTLRFPMVIGEYQLYKLCFPWLQAVIILGLFPMVTEQYWLRYVSVGYRAGPVTVCFLWLLESIS